MKDMNIVVIGMAGSGKTSFVRAFYKHCKRQKESCYTINLDPAVTSTPYKCNIDIRDSVNYKKVMEEYRLGPNGAIMTSLNLFTTKIDQVVSIVEKKKGYVIVDTPGQIEAFIWSATGPIVTEALATAHPTVVVYVIDTPRTTAPATFMSNMLYACSILYKTRLPFLIVFNKSDLQDSEFAVEWMTDFEKFQNALDPEAYMSSLMSSMSLVLEEFYAALDFVSVSSHTGAGMSDLTAALQKKADEFETEYKVQREEIARKREEKEEKERKAQMAKLSADLGLGVPAQTVSDQEDEVSEPGENDGWIDNDDYEETNEVDAAGIQDRYSKALKTEQLNEQFQKQLNLS
ncbi:hypothetical protein CANCADRAFT_127271 [Tortispora caseinolytica NRRL Y-17796]|uniref:GPN-loop GTPase n=1 Tax=Tortispora caseinolytica NRRL Y-17796 TaxID=767744 RepID=A0A1E4TA66_9ASCO|nr:hypothetical protein CANCADRAFT_127271 [Tortispora caseinolytica NRRL Y-17796]